MNNRFARTVQSLAIAAAVVSTTVVVGPADDLDAQTKEFSCDPGFYQVIAGQLAELDPASEAYETIGPDQNNINAMDYRIADGFLYGISGGSLERIDANGTREVIADIALSQKAYTGAFGDDGLLHVSRGGRNWTKINIDTLEATPVPEFDLYTAVADITNVHGVFYGVSSDGALFAYDQTTLERREVGAVAGLPSTHSAYGAAWSTAGGNLYVGRNTGQIYQITGYTTSNPVATQVGAAPNTNSNDGASCSLAPPMAGLDDVDGPESESEPRTEEAKQASQDYADNYDEISKGFVPAETQEPEPEPEPTPNDNSSYTFEDAGLGQGPSCEPGVDVDRQTRVTVENVVNVGAATVLYDKPLGATALDDFRIVSGSWTQNDGSIDQHHTCGFDYTALLPGVNVSSFEWSATFNGYSGFNHGGVTFHHSSPYTRSGAFVVDLADSGKTLRWGEYDSSGYFQLIGSTPITAPATGQDVQLAVTVYGADIEIALNGAVVGSATATHSSGMVGLIASETQIAFESARLVALPAPAEIPAGEGA